MNFIVKESSKSLYALNGAWLPIKFAVSNPNRVAVYGDPAFAEDTLRRMTDRSNTFVYSESTLQKKFGIHKAKDVFHINVSDILPSAEKAKDERSAPEPSSNISETAQDSSCDTNLMEYGKGANLDAVYATPFIMDSLDLLEQMLALAERTDTYMHEQPEELRQVERKICDELHYVEFMSLNGADGYKAYRRLHELRVERRRLKNEQFVATRLYNLFDAETNRKISDAIQVITKIPDRHYTPREYWPEKENASE